MFWPCCDNIYLSVDWMANPQQCWYTLKRCLSCKTFMFTPQYTACFVDNKINVCIAGPDPMSRCTCCTNCNKANNADLLCCICFSYYPQKKWFSDFCKQRDCNYTENGKLYWKSNHGTSVGFSMGQNWSSTIRFTSDSRTVGQNFDKEDTPFLPLHVSYRLFIETC